MTAGSLPSAVLTAGPADGALHPTNQHYDTDPHVFGLFLGESRKYSAGWYTDPKDPDGEDLDSAQWAKMDLVADLLQAEPGSRVLDIGSGWGALALHLAAERECDVTGVSPAVRQREFASTRADELGLADRVRFLTGRFEDVEGLPTRLDAVTALGSVTHMPDLPMVLTRARALLRRDGRMYLSESCFRNQEIRDRFDGAAGTEFVRAQTFGNGELRPLSDLVAAAELAGFSIETTLDLTDHYRRTIEQWIENIDRRSPVLETIAPGVGARMRRYLEIANAGWGYTTKHYALVLRNAR